MSFAEFLSLTWYERFRLHTELTEIIRDTEPEDDSEGGGGGAVQRRQLRR
jgi:hypothetical protein